MRTYEQILIDLEQDRLDREDTRRIDILNRQEDTEGDSDLTATALIESYGIFLKSVKE